MDGDTIKPKPFERFSPANCVCFPDDPEFCACTHQERGMRAVLRGAGPISEAEREWCLTEIDRVEGHSRADYDGADAALLVRGVFGAWTDYCRDKGLL